MSGVVRNGRAVTPCRRHVNRVVRSHSRRERLTRYSYTLRLIPLPAHQGVK